MTCEETMVDTVNTTRQQTEPAIVVGHLRMDYGHQRAVDDLSFHVRRGEIYALLGPNGAGKTTTVEILEGHRRRTAGSVRVLGVDPAHGGRRWRGRVGIVLQSGGLDGELTVGELVKFYSDLYAHPKDVGDTIDRVGLADKRKARARTLSGGQLRRLDLALALIGDPELVFLDEPTTGFDPTARRSAWEMIDELRGEGTTVLLTSHYLDEVQRLADRVGVVSSGRLIAESTPSALGRRDIADTVISFQPWDAARLPDGPWHPPERHDDRLLLRTDRPTEALLTLTSWAVGQHRDLSGLTVTQPSLEDAYLQLTDDATTPSGGSDAR
ncbi:ABC transporter ATP-binding protein [Amycolatopsis mongoliensis]|uniref:ABC transporter ATP-binding protein n=1 Tax=Amycolatopsis mongoliensis TaxID=715475 RepID=A0A9Y2NG59_9PSEU|nr:ABC transporter ATP-binding protein [Amycolatopsis sp. 4-36]WIX98337.1 ABC transporter ATP-binding protein [Amycolatopsis sp. 4-36]